MERFYRIKFKDGFETFMQCHSEEFDVGSEVAKWGDASHTIDTIAECEEYTKADYVAVMTAEDLKKHEKLKKRIKPVRAVKIKEEWMEKEKARDEERLKAESRKAAERKARKAEEKAAKEKIKKERAEAAERQKEHDEKVKLMGEILKHKEEKERLRNG